MGLKIGFFSTGTGDHVTLASRLLESAKLHMPDIPVYHLTDTDTEAICRTIRLENPKPLALKRAAFYSALQGDWLFVDTDIIFNRDVRGVFDQDFDVAFARREEVNDYCRVMPYNLGVVFSRQPHFWQDLLPAIESLPEKIQAWDGAQLASGWYATRTWCPHKIMTLPPEYNYAPNSPDEDVSMKAIVHYKGKRKRWLLEPIVNA